MIRVSTNRLLALALSALAMTLPLAAQDAAKVVAMENAWNQAELHNDAAAVQLLLADGFIMTVAEGVVYDKAAIVASVKDKSYHPDLLQSSDMEVHAYGTTVVVTGAYHERGVDKGRVFERRGRFTDTWVFMNGSWHCVASHFSALPK